MLVNLIYTTWSITYTSCVAIPVRSNIQYTVSMYVSTIHFFREVVMYKLIISDTYYELLAV